MDKSFKILEIHENATEAARKLGGNYTRDNISSCAFKNNKKENGNFTLGDYVWRYLVKKEQYICQPGEEFIMLFGVFQGIKLEYDNYMISNYGTVINIKNGYSKKIKNSNYPSVDLHKNNEITTIAVHILQALIFVPGRTEEKCYVNHLDEKKGLCRVDNLQWVTSSENTKYSVYKNSIPIKKISLETGEILGIYDSRVDGARSCGKNAEGGSHIGKVCNGETKQAFGFYWEDIPFKELDKYPQLTINKRKELYQ